MTNKTSVRTSGMSTSGLLGVVFVTLKLCGVIHWSWWWVAAPFWAVPALLIGFGLLCLVGAAVVAAIAGILTLVEGRRRKARREALRG